MDCCQHKPNHDPEIFIAKKQESCETGFSHLFNRCQRSTRHVHVYRAVNVRNILRLRPVDNQAG